MGNRRIADDPFAGGVDVPPGGQIHHGVAAPADGPHHLFHLFRDRRRHGGIADIGVDLGQEVASDDHGLGFGVVDIGGQDGAAAGDFGAHEVGRHLVGNVGAEILAIAQRGGGVQFGPLHVLADGDVFHLGGDDAGAGIGQLGRSLARLGPERLAPGAIEHRHADGLARLEAVILGAMGAAGIMLDVAALENPLLAQRRQTLGDVHRRRRIGVRAGTVVDPYRRLARTRGQVDLAHGDTDVGAGPLNMDLARTGHGTGGDLKGAIGHGRLFPAWSACGPSDGRNGAVSAPIPSPE